MICPACKSHNTVFDGVDNVCIDCKKRWLRDGESRVDLLKNVENIPKVIPHETVIKTERREDAMEKECRNCGRKKNIVGDGLCGGCYHAVKGLLKDTPKYEIALSAAKERFTNPNAKGLPRGRKKSVKPPSNITQNIPEVKKTASAKPIASKKDILVVLEDRAHVIMEEFQEITKTIQIIKKYQAA